MTENGETARIFVSYRRSESGTAGRIFDRLVAHFGASNVFIDIDNIPFGVDFRQHIGEALRPGDLMLAIVGRSWLGPLENGKRRIDDETDPVRVEVETALERDIAVLPVLVDDASMPAAAELPESIQGFAFRNAAEVEPGRDFNFHVDRLIRSIDETFAGKLSPRPAAVPASKPKRTRRVLFPAIIGVASLMVVAFGAAIYLIGGRVAVESDDSNYAGGRVALESGASTYAVEVTRSKRDPASDAALNAWNAVKDMESVAALEAFVARYGDSFYAELAKAKLHELKRDGETEVAAVAPSLSTPEAPIVWTSSTGSDRQTVGTEAMATDGVTILDGGCNTRLAPGFYATLFNYGGDALDRIDDESRPVIFTVKKGDGAARSFSASMHYFAPDAAWVLSDPLPIGFLDEFASGDTLTLKNALGVEVASFELTGADEVRAAIREVCNM